jgi:hypothetical protein
VAAAFVRVIALGKHQRTDDVYGEPNGTTKIASLY